MKKLVIIVSVIENVVVGAELSVADWSGKSSVIINFRHPFLGLLQRFFSKVVKPHANKKSNEIIQTCTRFSGQSVEPKINVDSSSIVLPKGILPETYEVELCEEGVNGTYFIKDPQGKSIGIFKPQDEEATAENSPKKSNSDSLPLVEGILPEEAAEREIAAYLLDKDGFYDVPPTYLATLSHPNFYDKEKSSDEMKIKTGSFQKFVESQCSSWDIGSDIFPVDQVHKIGILDLQIFNADRHGGNILVQKNSDGIKLIPIDNGYSFPDKLNTRMWFEWMNWSQSKVPFSEELRKKIAEIDLESNIEILKSRLNIRPECLNMMRIGTTLLKKGAAQNLTLYDIASLLCRVQSLEQPSKLEQMCDLAKSRSNGDQESYLCNLYSLMDEEIASFPSNPCNL